MRELSPREKRSKAMFGTKDALDVFGAVSSYSTDPPETFSVQGVQEQFFDPRTVSINSIRRHITKLEKLEAIERVQNEGPAYLYQRLEDPLWNLVTAMVSSEIDRSLDA
ncbi:MAG TPA: hypothetical protein VLE74_02830 [Candidatus Saccharimonadales bacterium]|nr:hypothetical protein [Candidatus Saccharimonadales bacterium]